MSRIPYRSTDDRVPVSPKQAPLGFVETVRGKIAKLSREVQGFRDKLTYKYGEGVPASYIGVREFVPEAQTFDLNILSTGNAADEEPVQYVMRDGVEHTIPIQLFGPGVFMARYVVFTIYQKYHDPDVGWMQIPVPFGKSLYQLSTTGDSTGLQTIKWHIFSDLAGFGSLASDRLPGVNFFWNMTDSDSGRQLSDDWMPHTTLLPQHYQNLVDGDLSEFEVPWLFERAGVVDFRFRLINPILQLAANASVTPFQGVDDLVAGERRMSTIVRAELHGQKFYSSRDLLLREAV